MMSGETKEMFEYEGKGKINKINIETNLNIIFLNHGHYINYGQNVDSQKKPNL